MASVPVRKEKEGATMAKGQMRSTKEARKPKKDKAKKGSAAAPSAKGLGPKE
jgi:hypothetical protein